MYTFTFKNRAEYIAQTKEWSKLYSEQIANIRAAKVQYKQAQRDGELVWAAQRLINEGNKNLSLLRSARVNSRIEAHSQYLKNQTAKA